MSEASTSHNNTGPAAGHAAFAQPLVFISYAHADAKWLAQFERHLKPLLRGKHIDAWSDKRIQMSQNWHQEIQSSLSRASAAVLLVSPHYLASDYIADHELPVLLHKAAEQGLKIFSIILAPCAFEEAEFQYPDPKTGPHSLKLSVFQAANSPTKTLKDMRGQGRERTLLAVAKQIASLANTPQGTDSTPAPAQTTPSASAHPISAADRALYAHLIQTAERWLMLKKWHRDIHWMTRQPPEWEQRLIDNIDRFKDLITRAVWPKALPELEASLRCISHAFSEAARILQLHCETQGKKCFGRSFYKDRGLNPNYDRDLNRYFAWMDEYKAAMQFLAKALNWFSDVVRAHIDPEFHRREGYFALEYQEPPPRFTPEEQKAATLRFSPEPSRSE